MMSLDNRVILRSNPSQNRWECDEQENDIQTILLYQPITITLNAALVPHIFGQRGGAELIGRGSGTSRLRPGTASACINCYYKNRSRQ